jgi:SAM-dependent methyltransferase
MRELSVCPICNHDEFYSLSGFDYKPGPEIYKFLGLIETKSIWSICKKCGFLFQNPRPSTEAIISLYEAGLYRLERNYDEGFFRSRYEIPRRHLAWAKQKETLPNRNVLDIGAGFGGAVKAFIDKGFAAKGVELDPNLCAAAKNRFDVELINSDIMGCNFPAESFGMIYSAHVHEHFDDFDRVNKRLVSWLDPGGYLLCILPTYRCAAKNGQGFINVFHNSIFTKTSLKNMFLKCGLLPVSFRYPMAPSYAEVWGLARKPWPTEKPLDFHGNFSKEIWRFVSVEIQHGPPLFELLYRLATLSAIFPRLLKRLKEHISVHSI